MKFILDSLEYVQSVKKNRTRREPPLDFVSGISRPQKRDQTLKYNEKYFGFFGKILNFHDFSDFFGFFSKISKNLEKVGFRLISLYISMQM